MSHQLLTVLAIYPLRFLVLKIKDLPQQTYFQISSEDLKSFWLRQLEVD